MLTSLTTYQLHLNQMLNQIHPILTTSIELPNETTEFHRGCPRPGGDILNRDSDAIDGPLEDGLEKDPGAAECVRS